jgi:HlyD family type I secretion membrane fusion protein
MAETIVFPETADESLDANWLGEQTSTATRLFELGRLNLTNQLAITDKRLAQLRQQTLGLKREQQAKTDQLGFMSEEIESWKGMVEKKLANKLRFLQIQSEAAELRGIIAQVEAQQAEVQVKIGEVQLERLQAQQMYQESAAKELRDIQFSLKDIHERLATSQNVLGRVDIRAPVSGTVTGLKVHTIGAVVKPGDLVMEIVPDQDKLIIETRVAPTDIDQVYQGMSARIRISAYKRHELPELEGHIESISADSFEDERAQSHYYLARISIDRFVPDGETGLQESTADMSAIQPGMPSEVMIITGESTPAQYLMDPLLNAFNRAWRDS